MYSGLVAALLISLLLTLISVFLFRRKGPWGSAWTFFLVVFLTLWVVSIYIAPIGPIYIGIAWAPLIIAGILLTILLIASMPTANDWRDESIKSTSETKKESLQRPVSRFFWVLIVLLAMAIMIGMMNPQKAL
jgi:hypothetical protein